MKCVTPCLIPDRFCKVSVVVLVIISGIDVAVSRGCGWHPVRTPNPKPNPPRAPALIPNPNPNSEERVTVFDLALAARSFISEEGQPEDGYLLGIRKRVPARTRPLTGLGGSCGAAGDEARGALASRLQCVGFRRVRAQLGLEAGRHLPRQSAWLASWSGRRA